MQARPSQQATQSSAPRTRPGVEIVYRQPKFGDFEGLPKYWAGGNPQASFIIGVFSLVIPEGEKFFIRTVNAMRSHVRDPELLADVKGFAKQEAAHTRAHITFNAALAKHGFDVDDATVATKRIFAFIEKWFSKRAALAVTVFAEHLTALGAEVEFEFPELRQRVEPRAAEFWRWHAAEELEHKAVAFDVYRAAGGGYFTRVFAVLLLAVLWPLMMRSMIRRQVRGYRAVRTSEQAASMSGVFKRNPDLAPRMRRFVRSYLLSYFRPGFHPWQVDSSQALDAWKREFSSKEAAYGA